MNSLLFPLLLAVAGGCALLGMMLYLHYRLIRFTEVLNRTTAQVDAFSEASVNLGDAVRRVLLAEQPIPELRAVNRSFSSRRLLLQQAQNQLRQGIPSAEVATACGLAEDEVRLLRALRGGSHSVSA